MHLCPVHILGGFFWNRDVARKLLGHEEIWGRESLSGVWGEARKARDKNDSTNLASLSLIQTLRPGRSSTDLRNLMSPELMQPNIALSTRWSNMHISNKNTQIMWTEPTCRYTLYARGWMLGHCALPVRIQTDVSMQSDDIRWAIVLASLWPSYAAFLEEHREKLPTLTS